MIHTMYIILSNEHIPSRVLAKILFDTFTNASFLTKTHEHLRHYQHPLYRVVSIPLAMLEFLLIYLFFYYFNFTILFNLHDVQFLFKHTYVVNTFMF